MPDWFHGDVHAEEVETLHLPLSRQVYQLRSDGSWRHVSRHQYDDEVAGLFRPTSGDWVPASSQVGLGGKAQSAPGARDDQETWWLIYGDARDGPARVVLADGREPPVVEFGPLWICEWVGRRQPAVASVGERSVTLFHRVPGYVRKA